MVEKNKRGKTDSASTTLLIVLIALGAVFTLIALQTQTPTGSIIYTTDDCSFENISVIWDSVFVEDASGIVIINDSSCSRWYAYKIDGDHLHYLHNFVLFGEGVVATEGYFNSTLLDLITSDDIDVMLPGSFSISIPADEPDNFTANAFEHIDPITDPETAFTGVFRADTHTWVNTTDLLDENSTGFLFTNTTEFDTGSGNITNSSFGWVHSNLTMMYYVFMTSSECIPSWVEETVDCGSDETKTITYIDENSCEDDTDLPDNNGTVVGCDLDDNGLIGNVSEVSTSSGISLEIEINDSELNQSLTYKDQGNLDVEIFDGSDEIIEFEWNFDYGPLNLKDITIETQASGDDFGYIIIQGIDEDKDVKFDKLINDSDSVCVADMEIDEISDISDDCDKDDEYLIECDGQSDSGYTCAVVGTTKFIVTGVEHSAIMEWETNDTGDDDDDDCTPDWDCTEWSACSGGLRFRTCEDDNDCGVSPSTSQLEEVCDGGTSCVPTWSCTSWEPEECPEEGEKTRTCTDSNSCGTTTNKPAETQTCTYKNGGTSTIIWIMVVIFVALLAVIGFLVIKSRRPSSTSGGAGPGFGGGQPPRPGARPGMPPRPGAAMSVIPPNVPPSPPGRANPALTKAADPSAMPPQRTF